MVCTVRLNLEAMSDTATLLRRKFAKSTKGADQALGVVEAALRLSIPRAADDLLAMDVHVTTVTQAQANKAALLEDIQESDLIYLLESGERRGICKVSAGLLAALTEMQMSGVVSPREADHRAPTRTDGIVASQMVDQWMRSAETALQDADKADTLVFSGFERRNLVLNKRNADLTIDPGEFDTLSVQLSLGGGAKTGVLFFATPCETMTETSSDTHENLRAHLPEFKVHLGAVLAKIPVTLDKARHLTEGELLELPPDCLTEVRLVGLDGQKIVTGKLGQLNGYRAVRLRSSSAPPAIGHSPDKPALAGKALPNTQKLSKDPVAPSDKGIAPVADLPDLPEMPSSADMPALPDLPDLPDLPPLDGLPDLPELPDLPDLPD